MTAKLVDHSPHALAALGLVAAGTLGICTSVSAFGGKFIPPAICAGLSGVAIASGYGLHRKFDLIGSDYKGAGNLAIDGLDSAFTEYVAPVVKKLIEVEELPPALKTQLQKTIDTSSDLRWLDEFLKASFLAAGIKNSGKTVFLHFAVSRFFENYPKGTVRIHDHNYGKRGNTWFDLPAATPNKITTGHEIVFMSEASLQDLVNEAHGEYLSRKHKVQSGGSHQFPPYLLVITELSNHFRRNGKDEEFSNKVKDLLFESHGYGVFFAGESQSLAVGSLKLSEAERSQLNQVLLGSAALDKTEVARVTRGDSDGVIDRVKMLRSTDTGKYAAIANIDGLGVGVHIVPHIDLSTIEIKVPESAKPESERWCDGLEWGVIEKSQAGITKLWEQFGDGKQLDTNPKYVAFKRRFEQLKNQESA